MIQKSNSRGFTLIELTLAMTFVSVLLLAIAMTTIQISNIYNRGLLLKEVNQAGTSLVSELQRGVSSSIPFHTDPSIQFSAGPSFREMYNGGVLSAVRLCTGQYSYIINLGVSLDKPSSWYKNTYANNTQIIRFVKISDPGKSYCIPGPNGKLSAIKYEGAVELLGGTQHSLALQSFKVVPGDYDVVAGQQLYVISFFLGTNDQNALNTSDLSCKPPANIGADFNYCAVNQFGITVRAGNKL